MFYTALKYRNVKTCVNFILLFSFMISVTFALPSHAAINFFNGDLISKVKDMVNIDTKKENLKEELTVGIEETENNLKMYDKVPTSPEGIRSLFDKPWTISLVNEYRKPVLRSREIKIDSETGNIGISLDDFKNMVARVGLPTDYIVTVNQKKDVANDDDLMKEVDRLMKENIARKSGQDIAEEQNQQSGMKTEEDDVINDEDDVKNALNKIKREKTGRIASTRASRGIPEPKFKYIFDKDGKLVRVAEGNTTQPPSVDMDLPYNLPNVNGNIDPDTMPSMSYNPNSPRQVSPGIRELSLAGILYKGQENWTIWLNGTRMTPQAYSNQIHEIKVSEDYVDIKWFDPYTNIVFPIRLRPHQRFNLDTRIFLPG